MPQIKWNGMQTSRIILPSDFSLKTASGVSFSAATYPCCVVRFSVQHHSTTSYHHHCRRCRRRRCRYCLSCLRAKRHKSVNLKCWIAPRRRKVASQPCTLPIPFSLCAHVCVSVCVRACMLKSGIDVSAQAHCIHTHNNK